MGEGEGGGQNNGEEELLKIAFCLNQEGVLEYFNIF